jgi:hypothetical protein
MRGPAVPEIASRMELSPLFRLRWRARMTLRPARARRGARWALLAVVVVGVRSAAAGGPRSIHDLAAEFSVARDPNGLWEYGFSAAGTALAPDQFRLFPVGDRRGPIEFWHPAADDNGGGGYYPYAAWNASPRVAWAGAAVLDRGDVVTFAVGYGPNRTHFNDTTALRTRVRWVGSGS